MAHGQVERGQTERGQVERPQIKAVIFDLDGLLVDSERCYTVATNEILHEYGAAPLTPAIKSQLQGRPNADATRVLIEMTGINATVPEIQQKMQARLRELWPTVRPLPGAVKLVQHLHHHGVPIAIATGSRADNLREKMQHNSEIMDCFPDGLVVTADTIAQLGLPGKPAPDVFLLAAKRLGITSEADRARTLVFEDGLPGVEAAHSAGMHCVWVPDQWLADSFEPGTGATASQQLTSLERFDPSEWGLPAY